MKKYFKVDFNKFMRWALPPVLQDRFVLVLLKILVLPIVWVYDQFNKYRDANLYHLSITPQVCYIEKVLNDRFDPLQRRIFISKGNIYKESFLFLESEQLDEYLFLESENSDSYLFLESEVGSENADFIVNIPLGIIYSEDDLMSVVDIYKIESHNYKTNRI